MEKCVNQGPESSRYYYLPGPPISNMRFTVGAMKVRLAAGYFLVYPRKVPAYKITSRSLCAVSLTPERFIDLLTIASELPGDPPEDDEDFVPLNVPETAHYRRIQRD